MLNYIVRRLLTMIPTLLVISVLVFVIIQLPTGDYLDSYIREGFVMNGSIFLMVWHNYRHF